jgi:hypothetical protein
MRAFAQKQQNSPTEALVGLKRATASMRLVPAHADIYEREADRISEQVLRRPESQPQRAYAHGEGYPKGQTERREPGHEPVHVSHVQSIGREPAEVPSIVQTTLNGSPGQPLDSMTRGFMESRFGHDFSKVRVHTDARAAESARAVNAQAYTVGHNVVFGSGLYAPESDAGRRLLAHELSHVLQQKGTQLVQRQSTAETVVVTVLQLILLYLKDDLESEIIKGILASGRKLDLWGTDKEMEQSLRAHIDARKGVVEFAEANRFQFDPGKTRMNPDYWEETDAPEWALKPGVSREEAYKDLHKHPEEYALGCKQATSITMFAGSGFSEIVEDLNVRPGDWIPGDWGYIRNIGTGKIDPGEEGENIIYLGSGRFWGLSNKKAIRTLDEWFNQVKAWNGAAEIKNTRKRPIISRVKAKP